MHKHTSKHFFETLHKFSSSKCIKQFFALKGFWADLFFMTLLVLFIFGFFQYAIQFMALLQSKVEIDLSPWHLPLYAFFSLSRMLLAYGCSLIFSLIWGYWAAKDRMAEKFLIPLIDILQSVPILGFMPGLVLVLVSFFPYSNQGIELVAILMIFTSQAWNMAFGVYHSICIIPKEQIECSIEYGFSRWQRFRWLELPCSTISLIWNSIMSIAGGWFFLMLSEAFQLGSRDFRLPGLGSYMSVAASKGDVGAMCFAIFAMIVLIVLLDQIVWRPLVIWSQKFRFESTSSSEISESWFLNALKTSFLSVILCKIGRFFAKKELKKIPLPEGLFIYVSRIGLSILFILIVVLGFYLVPPLKLITKDQWLSLIHGLSLTFSRVMICVLISTSIALPLGLMIGLSKKLSATVRPFLQVAASFPASLLFPVLLWFFKYTDIPLSIGSVVLMLAGTGWYVLFNIIAGVSAIPSDLREVAKSFKYSRFQKFKWLYVPTIFPYLMTGIITATGGAWNTSIVAEYISYNGQVWTTPGLGSSVSLAAQEGNMSLLVASVLVMVVTVALWNYFVWLRLYHYSEKRFSLNY